MHLFLTKSSWPFRASRLYHSSVTPAKEVRDWVWHRMLATCLKDAVGSLIDFASRKVAMAEAVATFNGPWIIRWARGLGRRNVSRMS